ncbi:MAG TPA: radical SAM protein [Fulvivirga sp.]|nr:radical SAM protein [Fulvivirga sp.]
MSQRVLFITPPFTQLNTPYPATAYLKGYLNTLNVHSNQVDLGIEVILQLFTKSGLQKVFDVVSTTDLELSENADRIFRLRKSYLETINPVIEFLQDKNPTLAYLIAEGDYLPEANRFEQIDDLQWAFGTLGIRDKARYFATLYLEDIGDLITEVVDPHFGFSRYAERLGMSASSFDPIQEALDQPDGIIDNITINLLDYKLKKYTPTSVALSVPFPGNLYGALKCGQYIKRNYPEIKIWMGGGYPNTELRALKDPRIFEYVDFIMLDDGEATIKHILEHLDGKRSVDQLKRTFSLNNGKVIYNNDSKEKDIAQREVGTPDYSDLKLNDYLSVIEIANPMHRLWSDGRWNKLTLAHGCYWGKCTFCDISLDYVKRYEQVTATILCDRIEEIIAQTGENGFHFVDEAAPPALMRDLAIEIIKRNLTVVWWTNIRFEQNFTSDLCRLLKASGCIAVSGGLEVASDRLLKMIKKGVTVGQVAKVTDNFTQSGIMVHAYLMYGFPTQTAQETIDSLEMVRQLFINGVLQSAYWHRFAMTAHSPVGLDPKAFGVFKVGSEDGDFANNDLQHDDPEGADHDLFGEGLRKSLFNYMHGVCFDAPLQEWFEHKVPVTSIPKKYIEREILNASEFKYKDHHRVLWIGPEPTLVAKSDNAELAELILTNKNGDVILEMPWPLAEWFVTNLTLMSCTHPLQSFKQVKLSFNVGDFDELVNSESWHMLSQNGLLIL